MRKYQSSINWKLFFIQFVQQNQIILKNPMEIVNKNIEEKEENKDERKPEKNEKLEEKDMKELLYYQSKNEENQLIKAEVLLVGMEQSNMEIFFYRNRFGLGYNGIHYLRTFGETITLDIDTPRIQLILSCYRLNENINIEYTRYFHVFYISEEEKIGRAIILCLSGLQIDNLLAGTLPCFDRICELISRPEYLPIPVLMFLNYPKYDFLKFKFSPFFSLLRCF